MSALDNNWDPVEDTDNLNQKMQIRAINEARAKVRTVRNRAQEQIASADPGQSSRARSGGCRVYLQVVKAYALELAPLIAEHDTELWDETALLEGVWQYQPGSDEKEVVEIDPNAASVSIEGVSTLLRTEFPVNARFNVSYRDTAKGTEPVPRFQSWHPSFSEIDIIVIELDDARKNLGLFLEGPDEVGVESDEPV